MSRSRTPLVVVVLLVSTGLAGRCQGAVPAQFGGRLAGVPCANDGDVEVANASVEAEETVTCTADGGTIRIRSTTVAAGARFHLTTSGPAVPFARTDCDDADTCNYCVDDVVQQFVDLFDGGDDDALAWRYKRNKRYDPSGRKPKHALENGDFHAHVQGFVKTNSPDLPFAGTYSGKAGVGKETDGVVFVVRKNGSRYELDALHEAWHQHPSGASILGRFLLFGDKVHADDRYALRLIDLDAHDVESTASVDLPTFCLLDECPSKDDESGTTMGGGVGMVQLGSGGWLLLTSGPGGKSDAPRATDFFYVIGKDAPGAAGRSALGEVDEAGLLDVEIEHLGRWTSPIPGTPEDGDGAASSAYRFAENLTVLPECGTGEVYVVHTAALDGELSTPAIELDLYGEGYWRLSRVRWQAGRPVLEPLVVEIEDNDPHKCHQRSAATAWAGSDHRLQLFCSEYKAIDGEAGRKMNFRRTSH